MKFSLICTLVCCICALLQGAANTPDGWKNDLPANGHMDRGIFRSTGTCTLENVRKLPPVQNGTPRVVRLEIEAEHDWDLLPLTASLRFEGGVQPGNNIRQRVLIAFRPTGGKRWVAYRTAPDDATGVRTLLDFGEQELRCGIRRISLSICDPEKMAEQLSLKVNPSKTVTEPNEFHFAANMVGGFDGCADGVLPRDRPGSQRDALIAFLKKVNLKAVRFPGGTDALTYFPNNQEASARLTFMVLSDRPKRISAFRDFASAMKEAGVKIIFQVNTYFLCDKDGKILTVSDNKFTRRAGDLAEYGSRAAEAAAMLERDFKSGVFDGTVDYWEIGNEEFGHIKVEEYADICAALIPVIQRHDPGKPICVTGFKDLEEELAKRGVLAGVRASTSHYPYSNWPRPQPNYRTGDYDSFALADVAYGKGSRISSRGRLLNAISETSVYNFAFYEGPLVVPSFAMAQAVARNYQPLLYSPYVDMVVFHDFCSVFFGLTRYDVRFDGSKRRFMQLDGATPPSSAYTPKEAEWYLDPNALASNIYFPKRYLSSPAMETLSMLTSFCGGKLYDLAASGTLGTPGGYYAGIDKHGSRHIVVSNPLAVPVCLRVNFPGFPRKCMFRRLDADDYAAILPTEYRDTRGELELPGNITLLPPRSILHLYEPDGANR